MNLVSWIQSLDPRLVRLLCFLSAGLIALSDWSIGQQISLGAIYVLPIVILAFVGKRGELLFLSLACALCRTAFSVPVSQPDEIVRFVIALFAYSGSGLFIHEIVRNQRLSREHLEELTRQHGLRRDLEEHLNVLAESSPAAIFTLDESGRVLSANKATERLFGLPADGSIAGVCVSELLPVLAGALKLNPRTAVFRSAAQCQGRRLEGQLFVAEIWFSMYQTPRGRRLAAIAVDSSDEMREREEQNLRHLLANNRIIAGAVSHEIRNICGAISMIYSNLAAGANDQKEKEFLALGNLVQGLSRIASMDLAAKVQPTLASIDLAETLDQLRFLIEPAWLEIGGRLTWDIGPGLPLVFADSMGLVQALLNLVQNSHRAVQQCLERTLRISARMAGHEVEVSVADSGPGLANPSDLFEPFQNASNQVGLGLYVSRALIRSYGGELRLQPSEQGCCFSILLQAAE